MHPKGLRRDGKRNDKTEERGGKADGQIRYTRERIASRSQVVKCFVVNGRNGGLNGCGGGLNGLRRSETSKKKAKSKAPPSRTEGRAPKVVLGFIVRATRLVATDWELTKGTTKH